MQQLLQRFLWFAVSFSVLASLVTGTVCARETVVSGSAGTGYDFRERSYKNNVNNYNDQGNVRRIYVGPTITVISKGLYDTLDFNYAPQLGYDFVEDANSSSHSLSLSNERFLTKRWTLTVSDNFSYSDDPGSTSNLSGNTVALGPGGQALGNPQDVLSQNLSGSQYWLNTATVRTSYALAEKSRVGGGYNYSVLRNVGGGDGQSYDDYDKHAFFTDFSHGFNQNWRSNLGLNYTRGLYDNAESGVVRSALNRNSDLNQYGANIGIDYIQSIRDFYPFKYSIAETQYDDNSRQDSQTHDWSVGWDHAFDSRTRLALGGGPAYAKIEGEDGTWGYNGYLTVSRQYEHASGSLQLGKKYEYQNFTGNNNNGLYDTYNARANFTYQYTQFLGMSAYGGYSWQSNLDPQGQYRLAAAGGSLVAARTGDASYNTDIYEAGIGLSYLFAQGCTAGIKYTYYVSDGDLSSDQYTDHRVLFTLSTSNELWRW